MSNLLTRRLAVLADEKHRAVLGGGLRGIERETLRVDPAGHLARTPHPAALGSALTHPEITTDYADGLSALRTIIAGAPQHLEAGCWLLMEHGYDQAESVRALLSAQGYTEVQSWRDLAGIERVTGGVTGGAAAGAAPRAV